MVSVFWTPDLWAEVSLGGPVPTAMMAASVLALPAGHHRAWSLAPYLGSPCSGVWPTLLDS